MQKLFFTLLLFTISSYVSTNHLASHLSAQTPPADSQPRSFEFRYGAAIADLPPGAKVKIWIPIAETNAQQNVKITSATGPTEIAYARDDEYKNQIGSFSFVAQEADENSKLAIFKVIYDVQRQPAWPYRDADTDAEQPRFLKPNKKVPLTGKPVELIKGMAFPANGTKRARKLYDLVFDHMTYDKSKPGYGNGDSAWACESKTGNCTDFHSLFISLSRNQSLAAKFEIGFPLPTDRKSGKIGGYHCWAWFMSPETGWTPVDISEADKHPEMKDRLFGYLPPDRIAFSTGRDIVLKPQSAAGPQNFFVYPHIEVDGKVWPKEKIELDFSFEDKTK